MSEPLTAKDLVVGGFYNWKGQPERLSYIGAQRYNGDSRTWHQFALVDVPGVCWCEVLDWQLNLFEVTERAAVQAAQPEAVGERWPNVEAAMQDPLFQRARAIMGTENWFQDNALRNVVNYVLAATGDALRAENSKLREDIAEMVRNDADHALATLRAALAAQPEALRPDILERLTYHVRERRDLTLDDCLSYLAKGWYSVPGRTEREMVLQILALLASAQPEAVGEPVAWHVNHCGSCQIYTSLDSLDLTDCIVRPLYAAAPTEATQPPSQPSAAAEPQGWKLAGWRHSHTHWFYDSERDVPLSDGDEWAEPVYVRDGEPQTEVVAWMHDEEGRVDVIHDAVKKLLLDQHAKGYSSPDYMHRPLGKVEHYTIPLYATPPSAPTEAKPAQQDAVDAERPT